MATHIFPSVNDVNGGTAGKGKTMTELNVRKLMGVPYYGKPYVKSGAAGSNAGSLNLNVALGVYCIEGYYVEKDATETVALTASSTCRVWLQLVKDGSGNVTGTQWVVRTDATVPSGEPSVLTHIVVTGASTITTIYNGFRGIIAPGTIYESQERTTSFSSAPGASSFSAVVMTGFEVIGDAQTTMSFEHVHPSFDTDAAGAMIGTMVRDSASGVDLGEGYVTSPGTNYRMPCRAFGRKAAFATRLDVDGYFYNSSGSTRFINLNSNTAQSPGYLIARFDF